MAQRYSTIQGWLAEALAHCSEQAAVVYGGERLSYRALRQRAHSLLADLSVQVSEPGQIIAIYVQNPIQRVVAMVAAILGGVAYVPLDTHYPLERLRYMLSVLPIAAIITDVPDNELFRQGDMPLIIPVEITTAAEHAVINVGADDLVYVLFTSGSTGQPKASGLLHRGVTNLLSWYIDEFVMTANDRFLVVSSFSFDLTQKNILAGLLCGAEIHIKELAQSSFSEIVEYIAIAGITLMNCTPSIFYSLVAGCDDVRKLVSFRYILLGGEKIDTQKIRILEQLYPATQVVNTYGPTECSDITCFHVLTNEDLRANQEPPLGRTIPGVDVYLLDENGRESRQGELHIGGVSLGAGYLNDTALTQEKFINWQCDSERKLLYKSGDHVHIDSNGRYMFLGRFDDQVKLRGVRIELDEIECVLRSLPYITSVSVFMLDDKGVQHIAAAVVAVQQSQSAVQSAVIHDIKNILPEPMLPTRFFTMASMPLTPNGKVDKTAVKRQVSASLQSDTSRPALTTLRIENEIILRMAQLLEISVQQVSPDSHFFELGGYSILAFQLLAWLGEKYNKSIDYVVFLASCTPRQLAEKVALSDVGEAGTTAQLQTVHNVQRRLFHTIKTTGSSRSTNLVVALSIEGNFLPNRFYQALACVVKRHPIFSGGFVELNGQLNFTPGEPVDVAELIAESCEAFSVEAYVQAFCYHEWHVERPPLCQVKLLTDSVSSNHTALFVFSHLIMDAHSWQVFCRDLGYCYNVGTDPDTVCAHAVPEFPVVSQFVLHGFKQFLTRHDITAIVAAKESDSSLCAQLCTTVIESDITDNIFPVLATLFMLSLKKNGLSEPALVFPVAQGAMGSQSEIWPSLNLHPLCPSLLHAEQSLAAVVEAVSAYHQALINFHAASIEQVYPNYRAAIMFNFHSHGRTTLELADCHVQEIVLDQVMSSYKMQFHLWREGAGFRLHLVYNDGLVKPAAAECLVNDFQTFLMGYSANLSKTIGVLVNG